MTKQQTLICDILANVCDHLTAEEVFFRAREKMPNIAMGTVYRNLNQLADQIVYSTIVTARLYQSLTSTVMVYTPVLAT